MVVSCFWCKHLEKKLCNNFFFPLIPVIFGFHAHLMNNSGNRLTYIFLFMEAIVSEFSLQLEKIIFAGYECTPRQFTTVCSPLLAANIPVFMIGYMYASQIALNELVEQVKAAIFVCKIKKKVF